MPCANSRSGLCNQILTVQISGNFARVRQALALRVTKSVRRGWRRVSAEIEERSRKQKRPGRVILPGRGGVEEPLRQADGGASPDAEIGKVPPVPGAYTYAPQTVRR